MKDERARAIYLQFAKKKLGQIDVIDATDGELREFVEIGRVHSELLAVDIEAELERRLRNDK